MGVTVTATTTSGQPLPEDSLERVLEAADMILKLDTDKLLILELVKLRMHQIAPNLSEAVGEEIAARLMGVAGGLINLSKMPACNVQVSQVASTVPESYCSKDPYILCCTTWAAFCASDHDIAGLLWMHPAEYQLCSTDHLLRQVAGLHHFLSRQACMKGWG